MTAAAGERARIWIGLLAVSALLYTILTLHAARVETPTVDEFAHLPAGCSYWKTGDFGLYSKNPPLLKLWMSLPVVADTRVVVPRVEGPKQGWGPWVYGAAFMNANRARYLDLFFRARIMIVALGLLTGALLFWWARELFSLPAAAVVTSLFLLSPTVLAHAHLATIDVGCALTTLLAVLAIRRSCRTPGWKWALIAGAAFGLALAVKYTAALLVPVIAILYPLARLGSSVKKGGKARSVPAGPARKGSAPAGGAIPRPEAAVQASRRPGASLARDLGVLMLTAILAVNVLMGFSGSLRPIAGFSFESAFMKGVQRDLPGWLPVPFPADYVAGFDAQKLDTEAGEFGSYLRGRWSQQGWWYYNLFALVVKEPETFLVLLLLAPWFWRRRTSRIGGAWYLVVPTAVLFVFLSLFNRLNIGIRYLLPVLPFLYLLIGPVIEAIRAHARAWVRWVGIGVPLAYAAVTAVAIQPAFISYFNPVSGGPSRGARLLLDSNIDWGQDLYRVAGLAKGLTGDELLGLLYFGHVDPGLYGIRYDLVPPQPVRGLLAVSVNFLEGYPYIASLPDGQAVMVNPDHLKWLRGRTPVARLGSIWVFDTRGN